MSPFVIFCCIAPAIDLKGKEPGPSSFLPCILLCQTVTPSGLISVLHFISRQPFLLCHNKMGIFLVLAEGSVYLMSDDSPLIWGPWALVTWHLYCNGGSANDPFHCIDSENYLC